MIMTPEQYMNDDYFSQIIINFAETYIKEINIILNDNKYNNPKLLEFNIYLSTNLLQHTKYLNPDPYTKCDYNGLVSGTEKYIILKFTEVGWIISKIKNVDLGFNIQHPKFATFK